MRVVYLDSSYHCHIENDGTMMAVETDFFDGKCNTLIEGYQYIPIGETWERSDGVVFHGEMISPWKPFSELDAAQREHERQLLAQYETELADMRAALSILGVSE